MAIGIPWPRSLLLSPSTLLPRLCIPRPQPASSLWCCSLLSRMQPFGSPLLHSLRPKSISFSSLHSLVSLIKSKSFVYPCHPLTPGSYLANCDCKMIFKIELKREILELKASKTRHPSPRIHFEKEMTDIREVVEFSSSKGHLAIWPDLFISVCDPESDRQEITQLISGRTGAWGPWNSWHGRLPSVTTQCPPRTLKTVQI